MTADGTFGVGAFGFLLRTATATSTSSGQTKVLNSPNRTSESSWAPPLIDATIRFTDAALSVT